MHINYESIKPVAPNKLIKWAEKNPKKLILIDGIGAILSAFFLGIILVHWQRFFGIPVASLYFLAGFPILFAVFDLYSLFQKNQNFASYLKLIGLLNLSYCALSISAGIFHRHEITSLGWSYLLFEVSVIIILALWELKISGNLKLKSKA